MNVGTKVVQRDGAFELSRASNKEKTNSRWQSYAGRKGEKEDEQLT